MISLKVKDKDLSQIVESVTWSGDAKQVSRKLSFKIASKSTDYYLPKVTLNAGDSVIFEVDGKVVFGGVLFDIEKSGGGNTTSYTAFDLLFYINQSQINRVYDCTAEAVAESVCNELDIPFGGAARTGVHVYMPCFGKTGYEIIMMAYTAASRQNGYKYIPLIKNINKLYVIEKGTYCGAVLEGTYNLTEANYKESLQKLVNLVQITDETDKVVDSVENSSSRQKYGTIQKIYKQEKGKDASTIAQSMLFDLEKSGSVSSVSDIRAVSGYSVAVQEPVSGLYGLFYIESDTHTFENGKATMQLTLAFSNMMDEKDIEKKNK